jgi:hypothetical protein
MYKLVCDYLALLALSVPSEEANSKAKNNFHDRVRLHSCTFKAEMCIRSWIDVLNATNISMPQDYSEAYYNLHIYMQDISIDDDVIEYMLSEASTHV